MTFEHKIMVGLDDIKSISYQCNDCGARLTFSPDKIHNPPEFCYQCSKKWWNGENPQPGFIGKSAFLKLLEAIKDIRTLYKENAVGFKIILEFDAPKSSV
ncbi:MAG: hypothetical protein ACYDDI_04285 [Candidatus Acidiferrales bacterium]